MSFLQSSPRTHEQAPSLSPRHRLSPNARLVVALPSGPLSPNPGLPLSPRPPLEQGPNLLLMLLGAGWGCWAGRGGGSAGPGHPQSGGRLALLLPPLVSTLPMPPCPGNPQDEDMGRTVVAGVSPRLWGVPPRGHTLGCWESATPSPRVCLLQLSLAAAGPGLEAPVPFQTGVRGGELWAPSRVPDGQMEQLPVGRW